MLVIVHSYYSTSFVPGQFAPDTWDVKPNQTFLSGGEPSVIDSSEIIVQSLGFENWENLSFILPTEDGVLNTEYLEMSGDFLVTSTATNNVSYTEYLTPYAFGMLDITDTPNGLDNYFSISGFNSLEINTTVVGASEYFGIPLYSSVVVAKTDVVQEYFGGIDLNLLTSENLTLGFKVPIPSTLVDSHAIVTPLNMKIKQETLEAVTSENSKGLFLQRHDDYARVGITKTIEVDLTTCPILY